MSWFYSYVFNTPYHVVPYHPIRIGARMFEQLPFYHGCEVLLLLNCSEISSSFIRLQTSCISVSLLRSGLDIGITEVCRPRHVVQRRAHWPWSWLRTWASSVASYTSFRVGNRLTASVSWMFIIRPGLSTVQRAQVQGQSYKFLLKSQNLRYQPQYQIYELETLIHVIEYTREYLVRIQV
jgi:hypothetical protein